MSNNTQQTAPDRIYTQSSFGPAPETISLWVPLSEVPTSYPPITHKRFEYIRADLQQSRAIEFARWIANRGYVNEYPEEPHWTTSDMFGGRESTEDLYEEFNRIRGYA